MNNLEKLYCNTINLVQSNFCVISDTQNKLIINSLNFYLSKLESTYSVEKAFFVFANILIMNNSKPLISSHDTLNKIDKIYGRTSMISKLTSTQKNMILNLLYEDKLIGSISEIQKYIKNYKNRL